MPIRILGISGSAADSAACLMEDGVVVAAVEEERLTRIKHIGGFPKKSVDWILKRIDSDPVKALRLVDHIAFHCDPRLYISRRIPRFLMNLFRAPADNAFSILDEIRKFATLYRNQIKIPFSGKRVHLIEHHLNHAASAFYSEDWNEAAILTMDYVGESTCTMTALGRGNRIEKIMEISFPHSLGALYSYITQWLGFQPHSDEYKVMGLAPYGSPKLVDSFRRFVSLKNNGSYKIDLKQFDWWFKRYSTEQTPFGKRFGPRRKDEPITSLHEDIAFAMQKVLEETVLHIATHLKKRTGSERLCLAGGVALNCVSNGVLQRSGIFKEVSVCPASHDAGLSIGAAMYLHHIILNNDTPRAPIRDVYWGPEYSDKEIEEFFSECKIKAKRSDNPSIEAAEAIANGKVVGWFQGREEFGPRALGSRSILADARKAEMKDIVNRCIKFREPFRPFAPACILEEAHKWFEIPEGAELPFMLFVHPVRSEKRNLIPAITHVDGTARIQTVSNKAHPRYRAMLEEFKKLTGVPMVLNTSFNVKGEPIVSSPADALRCFYSTGMDRLVIGNFILDK